MKEFVVYTLLRLGLFVISLLTVILVWILVTGESQVPALWPVVLAFALSGVLSYFLLNRQREAFARKVEERAARATSAFEERKAREDRITDDEATEDGPGQDRSDD